MKKYFKWKFFKIKTVGRNLRNSLQARSHLNNQRQILKESEGEKVHGTRHRFLVLIVIYEFNIQIRNKEVSAIQKIKSRR